MLLDVTHDPLPQGWPIQPRQLPALPRTDSAYAVLDAVLPALARVAESAWRAEVAVVGLDGVGGFRPANGVCLDPRLYPKSEHRAIFGIANAIPVIRLHPSWVAQWIRRGGLGDCTSEQAMQVRFFAVEWRSADTASVDVVVAGHGFLAGYRLNVIRRSGVWEFVHRSLSWIT
jgi:hypothetical protein